MAKSRVVTLPLAELIEDMAVYPRHTVDDTHVNQLALALKAGAVLPPLVADASSKRLVDGWHRARAYRKALGPTGAVSVELRQYESEAALLEDAVRLNAAHGRRFDRVDQVRSILLLEQAGVARPRIAVALHLPEERIEKLRIRVATVPTEQGPPARIVLKRPMLHLAGTEITTEQAAAHESQAGTSHLLQVRQVRDALRYDLVNRGDLRLLAALRELYAELGRYLEAVEEAA